MPSSPATDGVHSHSPSTLHKSVGVLSLLPNARVFPTWCFWTWRFFRMCFFLLFTWLFLILKISTDVSVPQQNLSWPYYLMLVSPFLGSHPISFIVLARIHHCVVGLSYCCIGPSQGVPPREQGCCLFLLLSFSPWVRAWRQRIVLNDSTAVVIWLMVLPDKPWWFWLSFLLSLFRPIKSRKML